MNKPLTAMLLVTAILIPPNLAGAVSLPRTFTANYEFTRNGILLGEVQRTLRANGDGSYVYESVSQAGGMIAWFVKDKLIERSTWRWTGSRIKPQTYLYHHFGGKKQRRVELAFDWQNGIVTNTVDNDPWTMKIPENTLDKLVYQFSIMIDLQNNRSELIYPVADGGELKTYHFEIVGEETLQTPMGVFKATRINRIGGKRPTTIWCAKELDYMAVRIEQTEDNGTQLLMQLRDLEWHAPSP
ncbi:MAG: isoprenoid biosynthesis protein [Gammaproteobacteria bacterium]|nr:MAG: isoprenoid biosynthesis protein [Gammaproteobacteria bacterium]TND04324.1 MAG: isoprenoid biosynthesis protein [Gammaproteobacteria bacterium]